MKRVNIIVQGVIHPGPLHETSNSLRGAGMAAAVTLPSQPSEEGIKLLTKLIQNQWDTRMIVSVLDVSAPGFLPAFAQWLKEALPPELENTSQYLGLDTSVGAGQRSIVVTTREHPNNIPLPGDCRVLMAGTCEEIWTGLQRMDGD